MMHLSGTAAAVRVSSFVLLIIDFARQWLLFPLLLAVSGGVGAWTLSHEDYLEDLARNRISTEGRFVIFVYLITFGLVVMALYGAFILWYRRQHAKWPRHQAISPLHRGLSAILSLPIFGVLQTPKIEHKQAIFVSFLIIAAAIAVFPTFVETARLISKILEKGSSDKRAAAAKRLLQYAPVFVVTVIGFIYSYHLSMVTVKMLQELRTFSPDMTIYTNILYQSAHGNFLGCSFLQGGNHASAHFDPILVLISPLFTIYPRPELLVVLQSIWLGLGVFPAFWLGRSVLKNPWAGVAVAAVYALHPSLQRANCYEFHSLTLISSALLLVLFFIEARYYRRLFAVLPFVLMIREDVSLMMCFVGISAILTNRKDAWVGILIIFISLTYFAIVKTFFMHSGVFMAGKNTYNYRSYFAYLIPEDGGFGDMLGSLLTNPVYSAKHLFSMKKFDFTLILAGPLLFIPLFAKKRRVMLLYSVIFMLLATKRVVFNVKYHYQIIPLTFLIALLPYGIKRIVEKPRFGIQSGHLMAGLLSTLILSTYLGASAFGAVTTTKPKKIYTHELTARQKTQFEEFMKLVDMIEPEASVTATDNIAPYVANRKHVYCMNHYRRKQPTDYLLLHTRRTGKRKMKQINGMIKKGLYNEIGKFKHLKLYKFNDAFSQTESKAQIAQRTWKRVFRHSTILE